MATVKWKTSVSFTFYICLLFIQSSRGRDHEINLEDEERRTFELSKFGFLQGGILKVNFSDMTFSGGANSGGQDKDYSFGFSLEKTASDGVSPYMEQHADKCILGNYEKSFKQHISVALIKFNLSGKKIVIEKFGEDFSNLDVSVATTVTTTAATNVNVITNATSNATETKAETKMITAARTTSTAAKIIAKAKTTAAGNTTTKGAPTAATNDTFTTNATETKAEGKITTAARTTSAAAKIITTAAVNTTTKGAPTAVTNGTFTTNATSNATITTAKAKTTTATVKAAAALQATTATEVAPTTAAKPDENSTAISSRNSTIGTSAASNSRKRRNAKTLRSSEAPPTKSLPIELPLGVTMINESKLYSGNFVVLIKTKAEEGLYNLYFHNCANYKKNRKANVQVNIKVHITERNGNNYLSAGEAPLPYMFGILSVIFLGTAMYWFHILRQNREYTYKVHYMMFVLVLLKALDLAFQAVNNHFISTAGKPEESWAVLYYITHLLKGALLFTTIVLIGTGYFFIKHVLSDRDKKIFIIVIPLQILANTAQIVMESTEEAKLHYTTWKEVFILVDLLCCGAILFPVVWSIRHLQEASQTDGKAAISLAKLKLFRHFYVMIVCYIYFTRIIVYLIKITVPFQYMWLDDFFNNVASYVFFVLTGYKFRPAPDNPYLHVPQDDSDEEVQMEEVVTTAGLTKGVTRLQPSSEGRKIFETA